tara:strand:- start:1451 stop:2461 length:1011 start_codon:yes stop_codon:yes gene_type:complete
VYDMFAGSCAQQKVLSNAYDLNHIKTKYDSGSEVPYGRNFDFVSNDSAWMTGMRVHGFNMYISNRGNNNHLDSDSVKLFKLAITSSNGAPDQTLDLGTSTFTSIDGFDLADNGTNVLIAAFHGTGGVRSGTLASAFDLTSTFTATGSLKSSGGSGVRACSWNNDGTKYYMGYGVTTNQSKIRQFTAASAYTTASSDTEGTELNLSFNNVADITFNPDGTKMYVAEHDGNLHQFTLTSAFDVSTAGSQIVVDVSSFFGNEGTSPSRPSTNTGTTMWICGLHWNDDGTKLYINSLWGMTSTSAVVGSPNPSSVTGSDTGGSGTTSRTNTFAVIEFSVN